MIHRRPGAVALIAIVLISAFALAVMVSASLTAYRGFGSVGTTRNGEQTFAAAEAGLQDALYRLGTSPGAKTYTFNTTPGITTTVTIAIDPSNPHGTDRIITSSANGQGIQRTLQIKATTTAPASAFVYAVQSGGGGIDMASNSTEIWGDLFANGPVTGSGNIYGDVSNSGAAGSIDGVTIGKGSVPSPSVKCPDTTITDPRYNAHSAKSHSLSATQIFGKAYYQTVSLPPPPTSAVRAGTNGNITCSTTGDGTDCFGGQADPAATTYPMTQQQIDDLKDVADNNTVTGNVTISSDTTITSRKIVGNLTVNAGTLTLDGPVWVTGTIDVNHPGVTVRIPASFGEASGALLTDQSIDIKNNAVLQGSGNSKSFLIIIALKNDVSNFVIQGANNSTAVIYFAPNGLILVSQNAGLNNTTGYKIQLENGSCVQYNSNLSGFYTQGGTPTPPTASTWQEL